MKIGSREKKFIFVGFGIIAILALVYALTLQQKDGESLTPDNVELKKRTLLKYRETLYLEGVYESRLQLYNSRLQEDRAKFLEADTQNLAEAKLLSTLSDLANRAGVEITQRMPRPGKKLVEDKVIKVSYRITVSCNMEQFVQLLTEIENYPQFLTIDDLQVRLPTAGRGGRGRLQPVTTNMTPILTVSGFIPSIENATDETGRDTNL